MEEAVAVNIVQRGGYLLNNVPNLLVRKWIIVELAHLHHAIKVHIEQLKDHVERVLMPDHLQASHYVRVLQANHGLDLCVSHGLLPRSELPLECLQSVDLLCIFITYLVNNTKTSFT